MPNNQEASHRHSIRIPDYDYTQNGSYFITICSYKRDCLFGDLIGEEIRLNEFGIIARDEWLATAKMRPDIELDEFVVMPNHIHGILTINRRGTMHRAPTSERFGRPTSDSIPSIIRGYKSSVTIRANRLRQTHGTKIWQRNYYEHVIRDEAELNSIREYIIFNIAKWAEDENNPANL